MDNQNETNAETNAVNEQTAAASPQLAGDAGGYITWNVVDNRLRWHPGRMLTAAERTVMHESQFDWWGGTKVYTAIYYAVREKVLLRVSGLKLEDVQTVEEADDVEERASRFEAHAGDAKSRSDAAYDRSSEIGRRFEGGQPILVGHHSERGARRDQERMHNAMRKSIDEGAKAEYWDRRADAARKHAERKQDAGVIARRIETIDKDIRDWMPRLAKCEQRGATENVATIKRILDHLELRRAYQRKLYEAAGGLVSDGQKFEVGGEVYFSGSWWKVLRVNPKGVTVPHWSSRGDTRYTMLRKYHEIDDYRPPTPEAAAQAAAKKTDPLINDPATASHTMTTEQWNKEYSGYKSIRKCSGYRVRTTVKMGSLVEVYISDKKTIAKPNAKPKVEPSAK